VLCTGGPLASAPEPNMIRALADVLTVLVLPPCRPASSLIVLLQPAGAAWPVSTSVPNLAGKMWKFTSLLSVHVC
jgi:hypothetical protein